MRKVLIITFDLFFLQDAAHHLLPEPSITPLPWKRTPFSWENSSHIRENFGSHFFGSSGATNVPSICISSETKYNNRKRIGILWKDFKVTISINLCIFIIKYRCLFGHVIHIADYLDNHVTFTLFPLKFCRTK